MESTEISNYLDAHVVSYKCCKRKEGTYREIDHVLSSLEPHEESFQCHICGQNISLSVENIRTNNLIGKILNLISTCGKRVKIISDNNKDSIYRHPNKTTYSLRKVKLFLEPVNILVNLFCGKIENSTKLEDPTGYYSSTKYNIRWSCVELLFNVSTTDFWEYHRIKCPICNWTVTFVNRNNKIYLYNPANFITSRYTDDSKWDKHKISLLKEKNLEMAGRSIKIYEYLQ